MLENNQDKLVFEVALSAQGREDWPDAQPRLITLVDHAADAFRKLHAAGDFGVHEDEFRKDALARFAQAGVQFENFAQHRYGTAGETCWTRLNFGRDYDLRIVEGA